MDRPITILIVDDQPGVRRLLQEVLRASGYEVHTASSGIEALGVLPHVAPDLILLDMKMPGMDGLETLRNIRQRDKTVRVIIMTAYGELEILNQAHQLGIIGNFIKPFDIDELKSLISNLSPAQPA